MLFRSGFKTAGVLPEFTPEQVKNEPMLFGAAEWFAHEKGGPITAAFLDKLHEGYGEGNRWVIDSRVHMLKEGWYPCIPGWHTDDLPRDPRFFGGQPEIFHPSYKAEHVLAFVDAGTGSATEFVLDCFQINEDYVKESLAEGMTVYGAIDAKLERFKATYGGLITRIAPDRTLVRFGWQDFHRGRPATGTGWRFFIRATRYSPRFPVNELRQQVQVYLPALNAGW